jgi:hypothetical protein
MITMTPARYRGSDQDDLLLMLADALDVTKPGRTWVALIEARCTVG